MAFEHVYAVWDYYDGPRSGIAAYQGLPHHYQCEWNELADDYAELFLLTPIDEETFSLAREKWTIWREWEHAFHRGELARSTHPALPGQHPRFQELSDILKIRISEACGQRKRVRATFRALHGQSGLPPGMMRDLDVEWSETETSTNPEQ